MAFDPEQAQRFLRVYRGIKLAGDTADGYRRLKSMLDDHDEQMEIMIETEGIRRRVRDREVDRRDVRKIARLAVNHAPNVYKAVARHIKKSKRGTDDA